jgi:hypothetical protein
LTDNAYKPATYDGFMNAQILFFLIVAGITLITTSGVQNSSILALTKAEDPDAGGENKASSSAGLLNPKLPASTSTGEEPSKPLFSKKIVPNLGIFTAAAPYKIKVTFTSVTVHNSHEGALSGDGEYDLNAYVHGKLVKLTDLSRSTGAAGLWDVSSGETVNFPPGSEIVIDIDKSLPLTIFTVGSEVDGCDRTSFPADIQGKVVSSIQKVASFVGIDGIQDELNKGINWVGCKLNPNDGIGDIVKTYDPTAYGAGPHADVSDKKDFTLRYTISVQAPAPATLAPTIK